MSQNAQRIVLIQGHPDPRGGHLCHALADAYAEGARGAGRDLRLIDVARLDFPLLRSAAEWKETPLPPALHTEEPPQPGPKVAMVDSPSQPLLVIGYKRPDQYDKDDPVFDIISGVLSGGDLTQLLCPRDDAADGAVHSI